MIHRRHRCLSSSGSWNFARVFVQMLVPIFSVLDSGVPSAPDPHAGWSFFGLFSFGAQMCVEVYQCTDVLMFGSWEQLASPWPPHHKRFHQTADGFPEQEPRQHRCIQSSSSGAGPSSDSCWSGAGVQTWLWGWWCRRGFTALMAPGSALVASTRWQQRDHSVLGLGSD